MKSWRSSWILAMGIIISVLLFQSAWSKAHAQAIPLRLAHYIDEKHPLHLGAKMLADNVEKRTQGKVKITIYPANTLGSPPEVVKQVKLGTLDMCLNTQGQLEYYVKPCAAAQIPFVFDDYDHAHRTLDGPVMKWLAPQFEKEGFVYLANWEWGFRNVTNNKKPIMTPEDIKGLKLRVPPEFHLQVLFETLGAVVTKIAWPELYMALSQNVVDGQENPLSAIYYQKFYEVQKHVALTRHAYACAMPLMSTKTWAKLNDEQKKIFYEESQKAGAYVRKTLNDEEKDLINKFEKAGLKVTRPDLASFRAVMGPAYEKIFARYGEENVKIFMKYVEEAKKK